MKKVLILLLFVTCQANAITPEKHESFCRMLYGVAETVMTARQHGMPLSEALNSIDKSFKGKTNTAEYKGWQGIIQEAYSRPKFSTGEMQKEQINEFAAEWYLECQKLKR